MIRLILLVILWVVTTSYFPDSRQWIKDNTEFAWVPVVKWNTEEEMKQVGRDVVAHEANTGRLPDRRDWIPWLDYRYSSDELKMDAWGSTYELRVWADSVGIVSYGPDRTRGTEDDFTVATPRERPRRRR